jgi:DNA repair photolyase
MQKITRKTLLYKSGVEYADFCINHAEGCSHGCTYPCYAMMLKKRCGVINNYSQWRQPKIVANALELLEKEIPKYKKQIKSVYLSFATDPFMYKQPEIIDLSLRIIARLNQDNIKVITISKGVYPKELGQKNIYKDMNEYGSTIVSLSEEFRKKHEPYAAPFKERIKALKYLHDQGLKTWVSMEPYPTSDFIKQDMEDILKEISFVDKIVFGKWNYNGVISGFKNYKSYYNELSYKVIKFCQDNGIDYHIKSGTIDLAESSFDSNFVSSVDCRKFLECYT